MKTFHLEIVTPTRLLDQGDVSYLRCPGIDGSFGVMAHHREAIIALTVGEIKLTRDNRDHYLATSGGWAEITHQRVQLLVETVERSAEIDVSRAETALSRSKQRLAARAEEIDSTRAQSSLSRALNRLRVAHR